MKYHLQLSLASILVVCYIDVGRLPQFDYIRCGLSSHNDSLCN